MNTISKCYLLKILRGILSANVAIRLYDDIHVVVKSHLQILEIYMSWQTHGRSESMLSGI